MIIVYNANSKKKERTNKKKKKKSQIQWFFYVCFFSNRIVHAICIIKYKIKRKIPHCQKYNLKIFADYR